MLHVFPTSVASLQILGLWKIFARSAGAATGWIDGFIFIADQCRFGSLVGLTAVSTGFAASFFIGLQVVDSADLSVGSLAGLREHDLCVGVFAEPIGGCGQAPSFRRRLAFIALTFDLSQPLPLLRINDILISQFAMNGNQSSLDYLHTPSPGAEIISRGKSFKNSLLISSTVVIL